MPRLSLVAPLSSAAEPRLRETVASLNGQTCPEWELVRADLASGEPIEAVNAALRKASGEFFALLDPGDTIAPTAVSRVLEAVDAAPDVDHLYTDEDEIDALGRTSNPFYKPAWSPDRLRCQPYTGRLGLLRRSLVEEVGGLRAGFEGAEEHDLVLRVTERARRIVHVPEVLYHRHIPSATHPSGSAIPPRASEAGRRAIAEHLARVGFPATVEIDGDRRYRLRPDLHDEPLVSVVIPTAGRWRMVYGSPMNLVVKCVESILERSTYSNYEIVCVIDDEAADHTRDSLKRAAGARLRFVRYDGDFNFARAINLGVARSRGSHLLLLNDDTQVITPDWIQSMLMFARDDGVGAVGAKLLFADDRIQHAGIIAIGRGGPGHPYYGFPGNYDGYADNLRVPSDYLAVTGACLLTKRDCFNAVGGFATMFPLNYNDVDYCLKLRHRGYRVVFSPGAVLHHFELSTRVSGEVASEELDLLNDRWGSVLERDPFYNPNFLPSCDFMPPIRTAVEARRSDIAPWPRAGALPLP
ncbi:MAG: glycosyltransferase family 2 protein [Acidimicrobiia bacterium]